MLNTGTYQLVQVTHKLCIDLQDISSRASTYGKLSCLIQYISNVYQLTNNPYIFINIYSTRVNDNFIPDDIV